MLDKLNPFKSLADRQKSALGVLTGIIDNLKTINKESEKIREINVIAYNKLMAKNEEAVLREAEAELIINKIENLLN